jgi:hypothetical protein
MPSQSPEVEDCYRNAQLSCTAQKRFTFITRSSFAPNSR